MLLSLQLNCNLLCNKWKGRRNDEMGVAENHIAMSAPYYMCNILK